jgi:hypothetical protein
MHINNQIGTLTAGEPHPASYDAYTYLMSIGVNNLYRYRESFASCAIEGNRLAEVCGETLRRIIESEPVSDRYLLGLAWTILRMENDGATN